MIAAIPRQTVIDQRKLFHRTLLYGTGLRISETQQREHRSERRSRHVDYASDGESRSTRIISNCLYSLECIVPVMTWSVFLSSECEAWLDGLPASDRIAILQDAHLLEVAGPQLGRPQVDHIKGSKHSNMK
jgi:hypothetical protein